MNRKDFLKAGLVMIGGVWVPKQQGATIIVRGPRVAEAATCSTTRDAITGATSDFFGIASSGGGGYNYVAVHFTAGATYDACKVVARLKKVGSPTFNLRARIYSDDGGSPNYPNTALGTASDVVAASSIGTTEEDVTFSGAFAASLTSSTVYWLVIYSDASADGSNHVGWAYEYAEASVAIANSGNGSSWENSFSNNVRHKFTLYST